MAAACQVEFFEADQPARKSKRLTAVFRDQGCGIEPSYVPQSIFALGSEHKTKTIWQQGAFGIGGATTFRNADAVVLVSRRAPEMEPAEDVILVAVSLWQKSVKGKGLFYVVTHDWQGGDRSAAVPWSAPATEFAEFEPGTHLALINYGTERLHAIRHSDNPNSFERVLDTRLFRPVTPVRMENHLMRDHARTHRGLARRFEENPQARPQGRRGGAAVPDRRQHVSAAGLASISSRRREHPRMAQTRLARRRTSSLTVTPLCSRRTARCIITGRLSTSASGRSCAS